MATQKDLLKTAILKVGSNGAMPSNQTITLVNKTNFNSPNSNEHVGYVAPCDGVLSAFFQGSGINSGTTPGVDIVDADGRREAARTTDGSVHMTLRKGCAASARYYEASQSVAQWIVRFTKTIGGGYKRYLPTLSRNLFGGALWLRLKTTSETSVKQAADWLSHRHDAPSSSRLSAHRQSQGIASTPRPQTAMSLRGLRAPLALRWSSVSIPPYSSFHRTTTPCGGKRRYLVPVARSFTTHYGGAGSSKGRSTSFLLSVASNNHYMEVAA